MAPEKVTIIGSGNWGSAIAKVIGTTAAKCDRFDTDVRMWVFEEVVNGRKLTEIINSEHENVKYLPGIKLPKNVRAEPDLVKAVKDSSILVFVLPHQFIGRVCKTIRGHVSPNVKAISLIKGVLFDDKGVVLISDMIRKALQCEVSVLMGANIATEVAREQYCETTVGTRNPEHGELFCELFRVPYFRPSAVGDVAGVELCGALKNVVALGAGFCDGLGLGNNTKAAIMRQGLDEIKRFCQYYFAGVKESTFLQSCGVADLITTCYGGRNRKCADAYARNGGRKGWEQLEKELLKGQSLQGRTTSMEVHHIIKRDGLLKDFPLHVAVYKVCYEGMAPKDIFREIAL
eukprot:TRINITY_DN10861_c0_g1_i1.p1 TRINITY_DN10861_c0_g1~~TRINITY_DN10861_c0_g1_i1.p1  ORF type:complete len:346 (+),score=127.17 TRINITY_DN10861_c0_g1_i1:86-1123(+)